MCECCILNKSAVIVLNRCDFNQYFTQNSFGSLWILYVCIVYLSTELLFFFLLSNTVVVKSEIPNFR